MLLCTFQFAIILYAAVHCFMFMFEFLFAFTLAFTLVFTLVLTLAIRLAPAHVFLFIFVPPFCAHVCF